MLVWYDLHMIKLIPLPHHLLISSLKSKTIYLSGAHLPRRLTDASGANKHSFTPSRRHSQSIVLRYVTLACLIFRQTRNDHRSVNKQNKFHKSVQFIEIKQEKRQTNASNIYLPSCNILSNQFAAYIQQKLRELNDVCR